MDKQRLNTVILELYDIGVFQFGNFVLKTGINSPIYLDLRRIISRPKLLQSIANLMWKTFSGNMCDLICGVPYTALPIATVLSIEYKIPMILKRKEEKNYGLKKIVEGIFSPGESCIIIEDVVTSGSSILETKKSLEEEGLIVDRAVVFFNRGKKGKLNLLNNGVHLNYVCSLTEALEVLLSFKKIDQLCYDNVLNFLYKHQ